MYPLDQTLDDDPRDESVDEEAPLEEGLAGDRVSLEEETLEPPGTDFSSSRLP